MRLRGKPQSLINKKAGRGLLLRKALGFCTAAQLPASAQSVQVGRASGPVSVYPIQATRVRPHLADKSISPTPVEQGVFIRLLASQFTLC